MKVEWSPLAIRRVREEAAFIALDKPGAAATWAASVFDAVERLATFPRSGRVVPEIGREDLRELLHGGYRIVYRWTGDMVIILTVRHSRRLLDPSETVG